MCAVRRYLLLLIHELKRGHITENVSTGHVHLVFVSGLFTLFITFLIKCDKPELNRNIYSYL